MTLLLTISLIIAAGGFLRTTLPQVSRSATSLARAGEAAVATQRSGVEIIHVASELDVTGVWQDSDSDTRFDVTVWLKHTGERESTDPNELDLFVSDVTGPVRIPHTDDAGGGFPSWSYVVEDGGRWEPGATMAMALQYSSALADGDHAVVVSTPEGTSAWFNAEL